MNQEHFERLMQGVAGWNEWRRVDHSTPDLTGANLSGADLRDANLIYARLTKANLSGARLNRADLYAADLSGGDLSNANLNSTILNVSAQGMSGLRITNLIGANLNSANLSNAMLISVNFTGADMRLSNLVNANLSTADLTNANLTGADFQGARFDSTHFDNSTLSDGKNLNLAKHLGPSHISVSTLLSGKFPDIFLRGCGLPEDWITYLPALTANPLNFYSCFISYSHHDQSFASRLHDALQGKGIRCWKDDHQLLPGDVIADGIDQGIRLYDKVLLCCSEAALSPATGWWVEAEMAKAFEKERKLQAQRGEKVLSLIPLNLDGHFLTSEMGWASRLRERVAPDFSGWDTDNAKFERELEKLIRALRPDGAGRVPVPVAKG